MEKLFKTLTQVGQISQKCIIMGDFNIHYENSVDRNNRRLRIWCSNEGFDQIQHDYTRDNAILDLMLVRNIDNIAKTFTINEVKSDHACTALQLDVRRKCSKIIERTKCKLQRNEKVTTAHNLKIVGLTDVESTATLIVNFCK